MERESWSDQYRVGEDFIQNNTEKLGERIGTNGGRAKAVETQRGEREAVCRSSAEANDGRTTSRNVRRICACRGSQHNQRQDYASFTRSTFSLYLVGFFFC